jgi:magnesium-transporting ATPase (P-type)
MCCYFVKCVLLVCCVLLLYEYDCHRAKTQLRLNNNNNNNNNNIQVRSHTIYINVTLILHVISLRLEYSNIRLVKPIFRLQVSGKRRKVWKIFFIIIIIIIIIIISFQ